MKKILFLYIIFHAFILSSFSQTAYWQQQVNYKIQVNLIDTTNSLDGYEQMEYYNNSPDTLHFLWIHLWANAFKNDRTAYSDQLLENGHTDFYFSDDSRKGYINRLNFKVDGTIVEMQDHPVHQDIVKLILPKPLAPGTHINIETPFHIQLPYNYSGNGRIAKSYQVTQWYPKPAVYDKKGWHEMPYLIQGGSYNEFGNYEVQITIPEEYVLATNGVLSDIKDDIQIANNKKISRPVKTFIFKQNNLTDFVWFADKHFLLTKDTVQLASGKIINAYIYTKTNPDWWAHSMQSFKQAIKNKDSLIGDYPYSTISIVENTCNYTQTNTYPGIAVIKPSKNKKKMAFLINQVTGYNWFGGILANNERAWAWMSMGMNTYYDYEYLKEHNTTPLQLTNIKSNWLKKRLPDDPGSALLTASVKAKKDQPIETSADSLSKANYRLMPIKTAAWLNAVKHLYIGESHYNSFMKAYYTRWQFKHPYPSDFDKLVDDSFTHSPKQLLFAPSDSTVFTGKKKIKPAFIFNAKATDKYNYIGIGPSVGYNMYDGIMLGAFIHNYTLPPTKLRFFVSPLYATSSNQFNGIGRISYSIYPGKKDGKLQLSLSGETFSEQSFENLLGSTHYFRFSKIAPSIKYVFAKSNPRSSITRYIQWKTFFITEQGLESINHIDDSLEVYNFPNQTHYINQLDFVINNDRVLYPYKAALKLEQGTDFAKASFTGNYFFNYPHGNGLNVRFFAGKFFYIGDRTISKEVETEPYQLNLTGPRGKEDYTYSDYYLGRDKFDGIGSQQLSAQDGFFKVGTDLNSSKLGKTDDWLAAINFTTSIPNAINPLLIFPGHPHIKLKAFLDIGTYSDAWLSGSIASKFLYDAGIQLPLFKEVVNIYIPIFYSNVYHSYYNSTIPQNKFLKTISFSIDLQNILRFNRIAQKLLEP